LTVSPLPTRCTIRVSTRTLLPLPFSASNSFQIFVPTGNCQWSMSVVSICEPGGKKIQRCLVAPSA